MSKKFGKRTVKKTVSKSSAIKQNQAKIAVVKERVQELKQLYSHALVYIAVNLFLLFVNLKTTPDNLWFLWVLFGWGIGLAFHWIDVMNLTPFDAKWEERTEKKLLRKTK